METDRSVGRVASVDAYRGLVMFLMLAEVLRFCEVSAALPDSSFWRFLCEQQSHAAWRGCTLHDLIQPSFNFLVGLAIPFSLRRRRGLDQAPGGMIRHAATRAVLLLGLGVVMFSLHGPVVWEFVDTLAQIGLAYFFAFLLALRPPRLWLYAFCGILLGYWLAFVLYPIPAPTFNYEEAAVSAEWLQRHGLSGFQAHWQKNSNAAWAFDRWFLNLFPRATEHVGLPNGLTTLNFIPTIATMILGLAAGNVLLSARSRREKIRIFLVAGVTGLVAGWGLGALGVCPVVKAIWTPSWVLFSGGWCFLFLAGLHGLLDVPGRERWAYPLVVVGANSIAAYLLAHVYPAYAFNAFRRIVGSAPFRILGEAYEPLLYGLVVLSAYWCCLYILYRRRIFLRL